MAPWAWACHAPARPPGHTLARKRLSDSEVHEGETGADSGEVVLRSEIERFGYSFELTPREREIVGLLLAGHENVPSIASSLGLSTNTVHNHFKNIFKRTGTRTKTGLMALFIERHLDHDPGVARRVPNVLLVEPALELAEALQHSLRALGMRVYTEPRAGRVLDRVHELELDALVADPQQHVLEGDGPVATVSELYCGHPKVFFALGAVRRANSGVLVRSFAVPEQTDLLSLEILAHCNAVEYRRSRAVRVATHLEGELCWAVSDGERTRAVRVGNVSPGGAYLVPAEEAELFPPATRMVLDLPLGDDPLRVNVEVAWVRQREDGVAGAGVRFRDVAPGARHRLIAYCRGRLRVAS